jgi:CRISPR-associated endonuclease Cas3-HD
MTYLANSLGQTLKNHSIAVSLVSEYLMKKVTQDAKLIEAARLFGLLHDSGKATKSFQDNLTIESDENKKPYEGISHHEVSWKVSVSLGLPQETSYSVYWHHAQPLSKSFEFERDNINKIFLSEEDKETLSNFLREIGIVWDKTESEDVSTPSFFEQDYENTSMLLKSDRKFLVRAVGLVADRNVSQLDKDTAEKIANGKISIEDIDLLKKYTKEVLAKEYTIPDTYDKNRSSKQEEFAKKSLENTTTQA